MELIEGIWSVCKSMMIEKGLTPMIKISSTVPEKIITDSVRFSQILYNIIGNSIKHTEIGEVKATIDWIEGELILEGEDESDKEEIDPSQNWHKSSFHQQNSSNIPSSDQAQQYRANKSLSYSYSINDSIFIPKARENEEQNFGEAWSIDEGADNGTLFDRLKPAGID